MSLIDNKLIAKNKGNSANSTGLDVANAVNESIDEIVLHDVRISNNTSDIESLDQRVSDNETDISLLQTGSTGLEQRVTDVENKAAANEIDIDQLEVNLTNKTHASLVDRNVADAHTADSISTSDNYTSEQTHKALKATLIAQGLSGEFGFFADGFTINDSGDVGIDSSGAIWKYTGGNPLPLVVSAGTVPSAPDWGLVEFNQLQSLERLEDVSILNQVVAREVDLATAIADDAPVGTRYVITDQNSAPYKVVDGEDVGGYYIATLLSGRKLRLDINPADFVDPRWLVQSSDYTAELEFLLNHGRVKSLGFSCDILSSVIANTSQLYVDGELNINYNPLIDGNELSVKIGSVQTCYINGSINISCNDKAAKGLFIENTTKGDLCYINKPNISRCKQTATTGGAYGVYISGGFEKIIIDSPNIQELTSTGGSKVVSGIRTSDNGVYATDYLEINNPVIKDLSPSDDADGIAALWTYPFAGDAVCIINGGIYHNCDKRAIKTQAKQTIINYPSISRDRAVPVTAGQNEIDIQYGNGEINNPHFVYANGTTLPATSLFTLSAQRGGGDTESRSTYVNGGSVTIIGGSGELTSIANVVNYDPSDKIRNGGVKGFISNCSVDTPVTIRPLASPTFNDQVVDNLIFEMQTQDISGAAFVSIDRAGTGYAFAVIDLVNCINVGDNKSASELLTNNVGLTFRTFNNNLGVLNPEGELKLLYKVNAQYDENVSYSFKSTPYSAIKITASYTSSSAVGYSLAREALLLVGDTDTEFSENIIIEKDGLESSTITITGVFISGEWEITVSKNAGSSGSFGVFSVSAESATRGLRVT